LATYDINSLSEATGVTQRTIYEWSSKNLLPSPKREGRRFDYGENHFLLVMLISTLRDLNISLTEIKKIIAQADFSPLTPYLHQIAKCRQELGQLEAKLQDISPDTPSTSETELDLDELQRLDPVAMAENRQALQSQMRYLQEEIRQHMAVLIQELAENNASLASVAISPKGKNISTVRPASQEQGIQLHFPPTAWLHQELHTLADRLLVQQLLLQTLMRDKEHMILETELDEELMRLPRETLEILVTAAKDLTLQLESALVRKQELELEHE